MIWVLVVDDDFMVARLHSSVVAREAGFEVAGIASTGTDALRAVEATKPDLVLLDIYLPDMTGLEVLRRLREGGSEDLDVIVISAARDLDTLQPPCAAGSSTTSSSRSRSSRCGDRLRRVCRAPGGARRAHRGGPGRRRPGVPGRTRRREAQRCPRASARRPPTWCCGRSRRADEDGLSATECAESTGLSRSSTRRYLEHLVSVGTAEMRPRYGAAGRPERRYRMR